MKTFTATQKFFEQESQVPISFKTVSDNTWFLVQKFIKSNSYIQKQINFAQKRSTGLEHEDFENQVLILCMETIKNCFRLNHECMNSENCINCPIFEFRLKENLSNYLRVETRDMLIGYAAKDLEDYENNIIASTMPDIDRLFEPANSSDMLIEELLNTINCLSKYLKEKERKILTMYIKGYPPKVIAQECKYATVQCVYTALKRIANKIKLHLNDF